MNHFIKIYRRNIYGVIGTLLFHILLFSTFLLSDVEIKGKVKEEAILIEFPDDLFQQEEEIIAPEENNDPSTTQNAVNSNNSNIASNRLASESTTKSVDEFLDENFLKELNDARKLSSDVKNQLSKETINMEDIEMPVQNTEGMNPDSIKNVIYTGESNITYYLENRYHISLPIPVYLSQSGGKVIVNIEVNRDGRVTKATPQESNINQNSQLYIYARAAALKTIFNADSEAPESQKGSIHYTFVAQ